MKFSNCFNLHSVQGSFEFFDIDIGEDTKRFVDPYYIVRDKSHLGIQMTRSITSFMHELLLLVQSNQLQQSYDLCSKFGETKGTRLGYSVKRLDGHGAGETLSRKFVDSLFASKAVTSGIIKHLEESSLVCEGIGRDIISDITISLVKRQLIDFTKTVCQKYGIPVKLTSEKITYYCNVTNQWLSAHFELPHVIDSCSGLESHIILIPINIVPEQVSYDHSLFYRNIAIPIYKEIAIAQQFPYVVKLKSGEDKVYSKDIKSDSMFQGSKPDMIDFINDDPETLLQYRQLVASYRYRKGI